jgi:hypothetical protein
MQNITGLRNKGFMVRQAPDAVGCTEVSSDQLFYYYNPRFASTPAQVYDRLQEADNVGGRYRLVIAGDCPSDDGIIPFSIVDAAMRHRAAIQYGLKEDAKSAARDAESKFFAVMRDILHA